MNTESYIIDNSKDEISITASVWLDHKELEVVKISYNRITKRVFNVHDEVNIPNFDWDYIYEIEAKIKRMIEVLKWKID